MKTLLQVLLLATLSVSGLIACGEKDKKESISRGRSGGRYNHQTTRGMFNANQMWTGVVIGNPQQQFQTATAGFVSAGMDPFQLGNVSGTAGQNTGVRFYGRVRTGQVYQPGAAISTISGGSVEILVWDEIAARGQDEGIYDVLEVYDYQVSGRNLSILFRSGGGIVGMDGTYDNQYFQGNIWFENQTHFSNGSPEAWDWGTFYIPVCDFFECR